MKNLHKPLKSPSFSVGTATKQLEKPGGHGASPSCKTTMKNTKLLKVRPTKTTQAQKQRANTAQPQDPRTRTLVHWGRKETQRTSGSSTWSKHAMSKASTELQKKKWSENSWLKKMGNVQQTSLTEQFSFFGRLNDIRFRISDLVSQVEPYLMMYVAACRTNSLPKPFKLHGWNTCSC